MNRLFCLYGGLSLHSVPGRPLPYFTMWKEVLTWWPAESWLTPTMPGPRPRPVRIPVSIRSTRIISMTCKRAGTVGTYAAYTRDRRSRRRMPRAFASGFWSTSHEPQEIARTVTWYLLHTSEPIADRSLPVFASALSWNRASIASNALASPS